MGFCTSCLPSIGKIINLAGLVKEIVAKFYFPSFHRPWLIRQSRRHLWWIARGRQTVFLDKFVEIERWVFGAVFLRPTSCHASFLPYCCFYDIFKVKTAGSGVVKTLKSSPYAVKNIDKDEEECYEHSHPASLIQMHQVWNIWNIFRGCHWKSSALEKVVRSLDGVVFLASIVFVPIDRRIES